MTTPSQSAPDVGPLFDGELLPQLLSDADGSVAHELIRLLSERSRTFAAAGKASQSDADSKRALEISQACATAADVVERAWIQIRNGQVP